MKAVIVGGGIGGLVAGLCFHKIGWTANILEQASEIGEIGAGIQISPNGMIVLRALGLDGQIEDAGFRPRASQLRRGKSGRVIMVSKMGDSITQQYGAPYVHIHRADLIAILSQAIQERIPDALRVNCQVTGFDQDNNSAWAKLSDGKKICGDVVVGADGIKSVVRSQMLGPDAPQFTGNVAWRAVVPVSSLGRNIPPPAASVWTGDGKHAVTYLLRGGEFANFVGVVERDDWQSESWTEQGSKAEALADFDGWHDIVTTIIKEADVHFRWALFDRKPLKRWSDGRVVLIGDAAHPMLPFMAQGAVQAMEDAYVLTHLLAENKNPSEAFARYFRQRIKRTSDIQSAARANMELFHQRRPLAPLRLASKIAPSMMDEPMAWIYGHDVTTATNDPED